MDKVTGRTKQYRENLENGQAKYYHMQLLAFERQNIEQHIIREVQYLAIAVKHPVLNRQEINYIYPIISVMKKERAELSIEQTGTNKVRDAKQKYWLFALGTALKLISPVIKTNIRGFEVKLTNASELSETNSWSDLSQRYKLLS